MDLPTYAYFSGKIVPYGEAKVGVLTHALNYGTAAFGGLRGYWNAQKEQLFLFRPLDHYQRFLNSAKILFLEVDHTPDSLVEATLELLKKEGYQRNIYVRPLAFKSDEVIGVRLHDLHTELSIVAIPMERYIKNDTNAHVTISSWRRVDDNMIPARGKISGAYVNSALIKTDAALAGFDEGLVLTDDGHISEGSAMNVFMLRDGVVITPPITDNILEGITRRSVIELLQQELGLQVIERSIDRTEVYICEEFFITGTAAEVTAVTQVDHHPIGSGKMGPITSRLRQVFEDVVYGRNPDYQHWNQPVYSEEIIHTIRTIAIN